MVGEKLYGDPRQLIEHCQESLKLGKDKLLFEKKLEYAKNIAEFKIAASNALEAIEDMERRANQPKRDKHAVHILKNSDFTWIYMVNYDEEIAKTLSYELSASEIDILHKMVDEECSKGAHIWNDYAWALRIIHDHEESMAMT